MWVVYALLSALFASATSVLAKVGIRDIGSNLATAVRTIVVLALAWGMVFVSGQQQDMHRLTQGSNLLFLILSGLATGLSWLFYYHALQIAPASKVAPIDKLSVVFTVILAAVFLHESLDWKTLLGVALIAGGTLVMVLIRLIFGKV